MSPFRSRTVDLLLAMPSQEVAIVAAQVLSSQNANSDNCCQPRGAPATTDERHSALQTAPLASALCAGRLSRARAVVDVGAVVDVEDVHGAGVLLDPVHDPVGAAAGAVAAGQRTE